MAKKKKEINDHRKKLKKMDIADRLRANSFDPKDASEKM